MNENMEFNPDRPLAMGELEWHYPEWLALADQARVLLSRQSWEPLTWPPVSKADPRPASKRFSPEFGALLRKRVQSLHLLSQGARYELCERKFAATATLVGTNIFNSLTPGVQLKHEPL